MIWLEMTMANLTRKGKIQRYVVHLWPVALKWLARQDDQARHACAHDSVKETKTIALR